MGFYELLLLSFMIPACLALRYSHSPQSQDDQRPHQVAKTDWLEWFAIGLIFSLFGIDRLIRSGQQIRFSQIWFFCVAAYAFYRAVRDTLHTKPKFRISSILILTALIAVYCGVVHWLNPSKDFEIDIGVLGIICFIYARRWYARRRLKTDACNSGSEI